MQQLFSKKPQTPFCVVILPQPPVTHADVDQTNHKKLK
jgi:hypothetical protein